VGLLRSATSGDSQPGCSFG